MARPKKGEPGCEKANAKMRETMLKKYGSKEAYHKKMQEIGRKGGSRCGKKGFALDPERARIAGKKGGSISRRGESSQAARLNEQKENIIWLLKKGYQKKVIAERFGVSYASLWNWMKKNIKEVYEVREKENN